MLVLADLGISAWLCFVRELVRLLGLLTCLPSEPSLSGNCSPPHTRHQARFFSFIPAKRGWPTRFVLSCPGFWFVFSFFLFFCFFLPRVLYFYIYVNVVRLVRFFPPEMLVSFILKYINCGLFNYFKLFFFFFGRYS